MPKPIYKAASDFDFLWSMVLRLSCLAGIVFLWFHYEENPTVIIVLCLVCFLFFIIIGNDEIAVYPDRVIMQDTSIVSLFLKSKSYNINEIKSASIPKEAESTIGEAAIAFIVISLMPRLRTPGRTRPNIINLEFKNGKIIQLSSTLDEAKMEEVVKAINSLI